MRTTPGHNLRQRLSQLGPVVLLATITGTMEDEKALHHQFGEYWDHGEYFRPGQRLMDHIASLRVDLQIPAV